MRKDDVLGILACIGILGAVCAVVALGLSQVSDDWHEVTTAIKNAESWKEENQNANIFIESCDDSGATGTTDFEGHELKVEATNFSNVGDLANTYIASAASLYIDDEKVGQYSFSDGGNYAWEIGDDEDAEIWEEYGKSVAEEESEDYVFEGIKAFVCSIDKSYSDYVVRNRDWNTGSTWIFWKY